VTEATVSADMTPVRLWAAVTLLTVVYTVSFVDRQIINLLVDPIRADLSLSDSQISLLQGLAFALPYILLSLPMGRIVDIVRRVRVLLLGLLVWTLACISCGLASNFWQLAAARVGVGAGEASVTPASWSLLADWFPPERRAFPVSIFLMGPYFGAGISLIAGAEVMAWASTFTDTSLPIVGALAPWQITFVLVAAPGLLLLPLLSLIPEPARTDRLQTARGALSWPQVWTFVWQRRGVYGAYLLGAPFVVLVLYAFQAWIPSFLVRAHGYPIVEAGRTYGTIALVAGSLGVLAGPLLARVAARRTSTTTVSLVIACCAAAALLPVTVVMGTTGSSSVALGLVALGSFLITVPMALFATGLQNVSPNEVRGLVAGAYVFMVNVVGLALGPTSVAVVTDFVFGDDAAVGRSLALVCAIALSLAVLLLAWGVRAVKADAVSQ